MAREALRLFDAQGYDATTLEEVARAAGVSARALYHYFRTKYDILLFFHDDGFVAGIAPTMRTLSNGLRPLPLARESLLKLVPWYESDTLRVTDRIWNSTPALVQQKQLIYAQIEATLLEGLKERWPDLPADEELRTAAFVAAGALRLAIEAGLRDDGASPLATRLRRTFETIVNL